MSIFRVLDKIENAIYNSPKLPWPLNDRVVLNKDKLLNLLERTRASLPEEMKQARWLTKESRKVLDDAKLKSTEIIDDSRNKGNQILKEAENTRDNIIRAGEKKREDLLNKTDIMVLAQKRSEQILREAESRAQSIIGQAEQKGAEIVKKANDDAQQMLNKTYDEMSSIKDDAYGYAFQIMTNLDTELTKTTKIIKAGLKEISDLHNEEKSNKKKGRGK